MKASKLKWTRDHKTTDGRFWCYKPPRGDEWQLWDRHVKDDKGNAKRYYVRKLSEAKAFAQKLTDESACSCMPEDETGRIATPSGSCPEHGWMVGKPLIDVL